MKPIEVINKQLKAARRVERLVRNTAGGGYYYVTGVACDSTLGVYRLEDNPACHKMAFDHVEAVLKLEGVPFKFERRKFTKGVQLYKVLAAPSVQVLDMENESAAAKALRQNAIVKKVDGLLQAAGLKTYSCLEDIADRYRAVCKITGGSFK